MWELGREGMSCVRKLWCLWLMGFAGRGNVLGGSRYGRGPLQTRMTAGIRIFNLEILSSAPPKPRLGLASCPRLPVAGARWAPLQPHALGALRGRRAPDLRDKLHPARGAWHAVLGLGRHCFAVLDCASAACIVGILRLKGLRLTALCPTVFRALK